MTLAELIKKVGQENIHVQYLNQCMMGVKERKKLGGTEISFLTEAVTTNDIVLGEADIGIVLWIPKDKWPKENGEEKEHECQYDSDGGSCKKCGKTVSDQLMENFYEDIEAKKPTLHLKKCEQCNEPAWDGYICHACGLKHI